MTSSSSAAAWWPPDFEFPGRAPAPPAPAPLPTIGEAALPFPELESSPDRSGRAAGEGSVRTALEEAYARGLEDGTAAGIASAEERIRAAEGALQRAAAALTGARDEFTRRRTRNLEALALAVAHHLVGREVAADPDLLRGLTARALELATDDEVEVRLHPDDLSLLAPHLDALTPKETTPVARWIADASMARGGVRVDGPLRLVDGRIETALRHLYERLDHD